MRKQPAKAARRKGRVRAGTDKFHFNLRGLVSQSNIRYFSVLLDLIVGDAVA